ncbi:Ig-like domain-containing protein [Marimonas sp. MJW-29]|uniref:Ig-like domain-containing protein n=1 Tax=Sulfitobacter sediminis TaxID=3234186 RepID=A0ABV3RQF7_9RHOB
MPRRSTLFDVSLEDENSSKRANAAEVASVLGIVSSPAAMAQTSDPSAGSLLEDETVDDPTAPSTSDANASSVDLELQGSTSETPASSVAQESDASGIAAVHASGATLFSADQGAASNVSLNQVKYAAPEEDTSINWVADLVLYEHTVHEGACGCSGCSMKLEELTQAAASSDTTEGTSSASAPSVLGDLAEFLQTGYWNTGYGDGTRSHNVTSSGTDANNGVLHYNLSGFNADADGITAARATLVREAFKLFEATLGIQFVETTSTDTNLVDFFFRDNDSGAYASHSYYNSGAWGSSIHYAQINVAQSWSGGTSTYDDYTLQTILHEIGHAIGLGHQGSYNGSATYGVDNTFENDSWQGSMMSYFSQTENTSVTGSYEFLQTPMAVDWMALDDLYGRQGYGVSNAFTEDTTWGFNTTVTSEVSDIWANWSSYAHRTASTIVDGDGIDTLDLSGYSNNTLINLAPSDRGATSPSLSNVGGRIGNLAIAEGTIIENAIGGAGSEVFFGNAADNILTGNGGNDTFHDSVGSDRYFGDAGTDEVIFGANFATYTIDIVGGILQVINAAIDWVADTVEWLTFSDQTLSWQAVADTIGAPNTAPVANDDAYVAIEDEAFSANDMLINDTDAENSALSVASVNGVTVTDDPAGTEVLLASGASLTVYADGTFEYQQNGAFDALNAGEKATDTFSYVATDGKDTSNEATVTISIDGVTDSQPPVAADDAFTVQEDALLTGMDVLLNDTDPDGDALTITAIAGTAVATGETVTLASGASVTLLAGGLLEYAQNGAFDSLGEGEIGTEVFSYTISDGNKTSDADVTVTVNGVFDNTVPIALDDTYTVTENTALDGNVLSNDSDPDAGATLTVTEVNGVSGNVGTQISLTSGALLTLNANGTFSYNQNGAFDTLEDGETATDAFSYAIADGQGGSDTANVSISIDGVSPPTITQSVLVDFEGLTAGTFSGIAGLDFYGLEVVTTSQMSGAQAGESSTGQVTISTTGENFDLNALQVIGASGRTKIQVQAYDDGVLVASTQLNAGARRPSDVTFDTTFDSVDWVVFSGDGSFSFDDISFVTRSPIGPGSTPPPEAVDDTFTIEESATLSGNLIANDRSGTENVADGGALTLSSVAGLTSGPVALVSGAIVTFNADGTFAYDQNGVFDALFDGQTATDSFVYEITDGNGGVDTATATVTIQGIGAAPTEVVLDFETGLVEDGFTVTEATLMGAGSGDQYAQSVGDSLILQVNNDGTFDFGGGVVTVGGKGRVDATFTAFVDGAAVATETISLRAGKEEAVTLSDPAFDAVDAVSITALGGVAVDDLIAWI